jgi:hypothetical protein
MARFRGNIQRTWSPCRYGTLKINWGIFLRGLHRIVQGYGVKPITFQAL